MFFDRRGGAFSGRLSPDHSANCVSVYIRSVDSLVAEGLPSPDVMKIDVEGGEGAVLEGSLETLRRADVLILCELHPDSPEGVERASAVLRSAGYETRMLSGRKIAGPLSQSETYHVVARWAC
jgi:hypothetical protein